MEKLAFHTQMQRRIREAVCCHDAETLRALLDECLVEKSPGEVSGILLDALEEQRLNFMSSARSLPEFILTLDTVNAALEQMRSLEEPRMNSVAFVRIVIGVVRGDPHDLGKNIIAGLYRAYGFEVIDLGRDVHDDAFSAAIKTYDAKVLALSAMMSTTMPAMKEIIREVRGTGSKVAVVIGGAPLDAEIARAYGADGYAQSARHAIEETRSAISRVFP
ncbi:MAG: cobalamin-dependent protein [Desulfomonilia bacterium]|nr:cobalamin-dependent protein [Desulfomonilia bacterium]